MTSGSPTRTIRLLALAVALALLAAACSSDDDGDANATTDAASEESEAAADGEAGSDTDAGEGGEAAADDGEAAADDDSVISELFAPTDTDEPFDTSGGATSSSDGVTVVDDGRASLDPDVAAATEPWTTDWTQQTIDVSELILGIPSIDPRDAIPPIDAPQFEPIAEATWLNEREPGALVQLDGDVRFYPLSILTRHEIVNDRFGDVPVAVTYCPLCNTAISFDARVDGQVLRLGVSGLLRNSDLVMWDDATLTLWQQFTGEGLVGELAGTQLDIVPTSIVSYGDVLDSFPEAWSLSRETGFGIDYGANAYVGYSSSEQPFLFDSDPDPRFPALSRVVGVSLDDGAKAYPFDLINDEGAVNDDVGGVPVAVLWGSDTTDALDAASIADGAQIGTAVAYDRRVDGQELTLSALGDDLFTDAETSSTWTLLGLAIDGPLAGEQLTTVNHRNEFWFAWAAFFPDAPVYQP